LQKMRVVASVVARMRVSLKGCVCVFNNRHSRSRAALQHIANCPGCSGGSLSSPTVPRGNVSVQRGAMEPTSLTCPKCGKSWKLIKAGKGPVTCPHCKAPLGDAPATTEPVAPEPVAVPSPAATATISSPPPQPDVQDADDPGLRADYDDRPEPRRRTGMNPLLKAMIILLLLMIFVPVAIVILLLVVCAAIFAVR
jgi:hypothetical protein